MGFLKEFKAFAMKGNVVDMAVGVIIGGAFGKIVSSLVADIIMPAIGFFMGGINFSDLKITFENPLLDVEPVTINYGNFMQITLDFLIVAFSIFLVIWIINKSKKKKEAEPAAPAAPPAPSKEEQLLTEIRDLLKK